MCLDFPLDDVTGREDECTLSVVVCNDTPASWICSIHAVMSACSRTYLKAREADNWNDGVFKKIAHYKMSCWVITEIFSIATAMKVGRYSSNHGSTR